MNRRHILTTAGALLITNACSNNVAFRTAGNIIDASLGNSAAFEPDYPDKIPYASISVGQKGAKRSLLILSRAEGDDLHWVSANRAAIVTRYGRIIRTVGFTENLTKTNFSGQDFLNGMSKPENPPATLNRMIDLTPGNRYGIKIESSLQIIGNESIIIGKHHYETTRIDEHCFAALLDWKYTNSFWLDTKGQVWRSQQYFSPNIPQLSIEITKPYKA